MKTHPHPAIRWAKRCAALAAALAAASPAPTQDLSKQLKAMFGRYDQDGDGAMSRDEFPGSDRQYEQLDGDGNGAVSFDEYARSDLARRFVRARNANADEPRARTSPEELQLRRLEWIRRFDADRNGRVTPSEWRGSTLAFQSLDANGDGVIDKRDSADARGNAPPSAPEWPDLDELPEPDELIRRFDRDRDGRLSQRELRRHPLGAVFEALDRNRSAAVEVEELQAAIEGLRERQRARTESRRRQTAFAVPFAAWDKNDDGVLDLGEFVQRKELFARIDADRDAAVTREEVERYRRSIEGEDFVARFDLNDDGRVTPEEFAGPRQAFRRADRNGDGVVTRRDR